MVQCLRRAGLAALILLLSGCGGGKKSEEDAVSNAMKAAVAGSAARVRLTGRTDWEVVREREEYWVKAQLTNEGDAGLVAARGALKAMVPYVEIGASPTEPQYFQMAAGQTMEVQLTGKVSAGLADRAMGCVLEVYPKAEKPR